MTTGFHFDLVSPERLLVSEEVTLVEVPGAEGDFTVLPRHAPVLSALRPGLLVIGASGGELRRYFVRGGFAEVTPAGLTVLAETAINIAELNAAKLGEAIKDAEEDVVDATDDLLRDRASTRLDHLRQVQTTLGL